MGKPVVEMPRCCRCGSIWYDFHFYPPVGTEKARKRYGWDITVDGEIIHNGFPLVALDDLADNGWDVDHDGRVTCPDCLYLAMNTHILTGGIHGNGKNLPARLLENGEANHE